MIDYKSILDRLGLHALPCPIKWTNENLRFFELGAFIETQDEFWIEINPKINLKWLGYSRELILIHEIIHALRKDFEDSYFEELIAYHVCKKRYQRFFGPFFSKKINQILCFAYIGFSLFPYGILVWLMMIISTFSRHIFEYYLFSKALKNLKNKTLDESLAFSEIISMNKEQILKLAKKTVSCARDF